MKLASTIPLILCLFATVGCGSQAWNDAKVLTQAQAAVVEKLVSPGSAKFDKSLIAARTQDGEYTLVYLCVDSQNKMGGLLRSYSLALVRQAKEAEPKVVRCDVYSTSPTKASAQLTTMVAGENWKWESWLN